MCSLSTWGSNAELCVFYRPSLDAVLEQLPMIVYILQQVRCRQNRQDALQFRLGTKCMSTERSSWSPMHTCCCCHWTGWLVHTMLLLQADETLAHYILEAGVLPYFALSWYITWFAHEVQSLPQIARLFDLFMASHPLMPLYVGAAAMKARASTAQPAHL